MSEEGKPNILIFMTDQQRAGTVLPGHRLKALTPTLDRFRQDSVTFDRAYCPSPHCCPSRATFFTGLYPSEHGVWHNVDVANAISRGLNPEVRPWSVDLAEAGYQMKFAGKWHVDAKRGAQRFGWDVVYPTGGHPEAEGSESAQRERDRRARIRQLLDEGQPLEPPSPREPGDIHRPGYPRYKHFGIRDNPFGDGDVVESGRQAIRDLADSVGPWCAYVGTLGPHDPYFVPQRFLDMYDQNALPPLPDSFEDRMLDKPALYRRTRQRFDQLPPEEHRQAIRHYLAFCSYEDWLFGQLLETLEATGQADETWVLYLSDHGDYVGDHGLWCKGLPAFDGCYHIPAIVRPPADVEAARGGHVDQPIGLADFGPTLVEIAGIQNPPAMSGRSLLALLRSEVPADWPTDVFFQSNGNEVYGIQRGVMTPQYRFVFNAFDFDELYDLESDPEQMSNLAAQPGYETVIRDMYRRLWTFMIEHKDAYLNPYIMTALMDYGPISET